MRQQHFYSGMVKVSHSSSTWARLPAAALRVLPRGLVCHIKVDALPFRASAVPQPDHEIGQLSCLPHPSTSSQSSDGTV